MIFSFQDSELARGLVRALRALRPSVNATLNGSSVGIPAGEMGRPDVIAALTAAQNADGGSSWSY